jgi:hypothetical protein
MPAVQLERLRTQINDLAWKFTRPAEFQRNLHELLSFYANRVYRPTPSAQSVTSISIYNVSGLIMRQLEATLAPLCQENPEAARVLMAALWKDPYLEPRQLAISMLGHLPMDPPDRVLELMQGWCQPGEDPQVMDTLFGQGSLNMRRKYPNRWLDLIQGWLAASSLPSKAMGLRALLPVVRDREFENLPPVFSMVAPLLQSPPPQLLSELQAVLEALSQRSPKETAYFLRQALNTSQSSGMTRLIRRVMDSFDEETQSGIRNLLK